MGDEMAFGKAPRFGACCPSAWSKGEALMQPQEQPVVKIGELEIRYLMDGTLTGAGSGMSS